MDYNPQDMVEGGGRAKPGEYSFYVEHAEETTFRSGNRGLVVTMQVAAFAERDVKVFDRMTYVPTALWKVKQFMDSIGLDFNASPPVATLMGKRGRAKFVCGEKGYLEAEEYLPAPADNGPDGDTVPF